MKLSFPVQKTSQKFDERKDGTIVFVHGNSANHSIWHHQYDDPLFNTYKILCLDLPGHGNSPKMTNYSIPEMASVLTKNLNGLDNFVLVGHSFGGHVAIGALPNLPSCTGLFVFGTSPIKAPPNIAEAYLPHPDMGLLFQEHFNDKDIERLVELLCENGDGYDFRKSLGQTDKNFRITIGASLSNGEALDEIDILKNSTIPVLLSAGENDSLLNLGYLRKLNIPSMWPDEHFLFPNSGHSPQIDNPKAFNAKLYEFLKICEQE